MRVALRASAVLLTLAAAVAFGQATQPWKNGVGQITGGGAAPVGKVTAGEPLPQGPAHGVGQTPAFPGQTRSPAALTKTALDVKIVTRGLRKPWALAFLPSGNILITEKVGAMRVVDANGAVGAPIAGVPKVVYESDGGLMDVVLDPAFATNRMIYFTYVEPRGNLNSTAVAKAHLSKDRTRLDNLTVIYRCEPATRAPMHYGSRLLFDNDGMLFVTLGERYFPPTREQAQDLDSVMGKILRITTDGKPAPGNPFEKQTNAKPEIWSLGHRNPQGLTFQPSTGELWSTEHGPQGGDEINLILPGKNYGWPTIAYGTDYDGSPIGDGKPQRDGLEQPLYYWDPAIAPSGSTFYSGKLIPEWKGNLFVAGLVGQHVSRLVVDGHKIVGEERLLQEQHQRVRDIQEGPDGALWAVTDDMEGRLIRIGPKTQ